MSKFYKVTLLLIVFIFLSTYSPNKIDLIIKKNVPFFDIQKVVIINNLLVKEEDIYQNLKEVYFKNIFLIKRKNIEKLLIKIDFLQKIEIKKRYPNTLIIKVFETKPAGVLFKDKAKYLLDNSSNLIKFDKSKNYNHLPNIFGEGAEKNFINFLDRLKVNNFPRGKIKNFYYFQIGRWDLQLISNKIIKFPHNVTDAIIEKSIQLLNSKDFENYNIIDLRVAGKIIVE